MGFNEAAALHRGKPVCASLLTSLIGCFNEAAALHRGKPRTCIITWACSVRFNEAAALHRGKRVGRTRSIGW